MCLLRRIKKQLKLKISKQNVAFVSAIAGTLPLIIGLQSQEIRLLKLILFPLAFRCLTEKLLAQGIIPSVKGGTIISYMLACYALSYCYVLETRSGSSVQSMIDQISHLQFTGKVSYVYPKAQRQLEEEIYTFATSLTEKAFNIFG